MQQNGVYWVIAAEKLNITIHHHRPAIAPVPVDVRLHLNMRKSDYQTNGLYGTPNPMSGVGLGKVGCSSKFS